MAGGTKTPKTAFYRGCKYKNPLFAQISSQPSKTNINTVNELKTAVTGKQYLSKWVKLASSKLYFEYLAYRTIKTGYSLIALFSLQMFYPFF